MSESHAQHKHQQSGENLTTENTEKDLAGLIKKETSHPYGPSTRRVVDGTSRMFVMGKTILPTPTNRDF